MTYPIETHMVQLLAALPGRTFRVPGPGHGIPDLIAAPTARRHAYVTVQDLAPWTADEAGGEGDYLLTIASGVLGVDETTYAREYVTIGAADLAPTLAAAVAAMVEKADTHLLARASDDWWCICGNDVVSAGFYTCTADGTDAEPYANPKPGEPAWDGIHVKCHGCGRIMAQPETTAEQGHYIDTPHLVTIVGQVAL